MLPRYTLVLFPPLVTLCLALIGIHCHFCQTNSLLLSFSLSAAPPVYFSSLFPRDLTPYSYRRNSLSLSLKDNFIFSCSPQCSPGIPSPPPCSVFPSSSSPHLTVGTKRRIDQRTNNQNFPTTNQECQTTNRELFTSAVSSPRRLPHMHSQWRLRSTSSTLPSSSSSSSST